MCVWMLLVLLRAMSQVLHCGFSPDAGLEKYFRPSALSLLYKLWEASHVESLCEVDGINVFAKCHSQQGKQYYSVSLHV